MRLTIMCMQGLLLLFWLISAQAESIEPDIQVYPADTSASQKAVQSQTRPLIVLPPDALQGHTLVLPLPGEPPAALILKRDSVETVPLTQPALPKSGKPAKNKPLDPVVY